MCCAQQIIQGGIKAKKSPLIDWVLKVAEHALLKLCIFKPGTPGFLKSLSCGHVFVCVCVSVRP